MNIHYFQRYNKKEDVSTANTMLLLSRLRAYSADKFYQFLKDLCFSDVDFNPGTSFVLQSRGKDSVPDAEIGQSGFKILVETKLYDWFYQDQLERHLKKFGDEKYKVLITIAPELMDQNKKTEIDRAVEEYNKKNPLVVHINTTFELLTQGIQDVLSERDYEMQEILYDYFDYCRYDGLIKVSNAWKWMRMRLVGTTFDYNMAENLYYDGINHGFSEHDYIGLYKEKSIRGIGKISAIITAVKTEDDFEFDAERGELTDEFKQKIKDAYVHAKDNYGYNLSATRYFFVEKFYETDYPKVSKRAPMGTRFFNLEEILGVNKDSMPKTAEIAEQLRSKIWS